MLFELIFEALHLYIIVLITSESDINRFFSFKIDILFVPIDLLFKSLKVTAIRLLRSIFMKFFWGGKINVNSYIAVTFFIMKLLSRLITRDTRIKSEPKISEITA